MNRSMITKKISRDISEFNDQELKEVYDFVTYLKHRENLQASIELLEDKKAMVEIQKGRSDAAAGNIQRWDDIR
ncbi:MAG TPA: hypothetical protein PLT75_04775 [Spirochaetota bacterium]|nr:hypothetical protein [Spirochaetota bacterium]